MPAVRPEPFDKAQDKLVEACGEFHRTRNGWHTQDRLREGVAISLNTDCGFVGALLAAPFLGQGKPCPYGNAFVLEESS